MSEPENPLHTLIVIPAALAWGHAQCISCLRRNMSYLIKETEPDNDSKLRGRRPG